MSDSDNKPTLGRKPLGLKKSVEAGEVKQTFSHGRTNKVVVEVKSRKLIRKPGEAPVAAPPYSGGRPRGDRVRYPILPSDILPVFFARRFSTVYPVTLAMWRRLCRSRIGDDSLARNDQILCEVH